MAARPKFATHAEYFSAQPVKVRKLLREIQAVVRARVPDAQPCISYSMPAFRLERTFFYFAAFQQHIGVYPPLPHGSALDPALAKYRGPKGNLSFPLNARIPIALIGRVAAALARKYGVRGSR